MKERKNIKVYSEIEPLKTVVLHRPGREIENLVPEYLERLLFDDIPFLKVARQEHDNFARVLENNGISVLYLENLAATAIKEKEVRDMFLDEVIKEAEVTDKDNAKVLKKYLESMHEKEMVDKIMAGVRKNEIGIKEEYDEYPFIMDPMPNLYFTRDPFASIGKGISINCMRTKTRKRETIFAKYIFNYHPAFKDSEIPIWYNRDKKYCIEGGDILVLSKDVLAIGSSQRTDKEAIFELARTLFEKEESFKNILIFEIPKTRAFMHLDTVFTMIDYDKFTVHHGMERKLKVTCLSYDHKNHEVKANEEESDLRSIISKYLKRDVTLINCGGSDRVIAGREQWNDGSNTLAICPGKVITYERNYVTNEILDKYNVKVIAIPSAELSRGRGGPRCMSMPLYREE